MSRLPVLFYFGFFMNHKELGVTGWWRSKSNTSLILETSETSNLAQYQHRNIVLVYKILVCKLLLHFYGISTLSSWSAKFLRRITFKLTAFEFRLIFCLILLSLHHFKLAGCHHLRFCINFSLWYRPHIKIMFRSGFADTFP